MTPERWRRVEELYHAVLARPEGHRASFLAEACGDDSELRHEIESLLAHADTAERAMGTGAAMAAAAAMMTGTSSSVLIGRRLGPYELLAPLGAGGMGEVYRARDTKLGREVAIKILPAEFTAHPDRLARFEREARVLAALNHPHIAAIHGVEDSAGTHALVLELVEGETLAERIARGAGPAGQARGGTHVDRTDRGRSDGLSGPPMPIAEALEIARQIADALEAAHEKGIVHRDLKPANIKITPEGVVKVLDFGLAKIESAGSGQQAAGSASPTITIGRTHDGVIVGTAAYMSPEQARGKAVDKRADIWAFGCVLYEMLVGRPPFAAQTVSDTIAAILDREPPLAALPPATPASVRRLLQRCLEKDPTRRLRDVADADLAFALQGLSSSSEPTAAPVNEPRGKAFAGSRTAWSITGVLLAVSAALGAALIFRGGPSEPSKTRLDIVTRSPLRRFTLSPDGKYLVADIVPQETPAGVLWLRPLDQTRGKVLAGTEGAGPTFWSPDGKSIAFFADDKLKRIDLTGAPPQIVADAPDARGTGTWNQQDVILFAGPNGIVRVPASGGKPEPVTELDRSRQETAHRHPHFLPDGRHFLYTIASELPENSGIFLGTFDSKERKRLLSSGLNAAFAPPDHVLFARIGAQASEATLMAQRFDPVRLELNGDPFPVAESVSISVIDVAAPFAVSGNGIMAYRAAADAAPTLARLTWFDRSGKSLGTLGEPGNYRNPRQSPDGVRVALEALDSSGNRDVWVIDSRGTATRFTANSQSDTSPVWSPDGRRIAWRRGELLNTSLYSKPSNGLGQEEKLPIAPLDWVLDEWSRGDVLLIHTGIATGAFGLRLLPLSGGSPRVIHSDRVQATHYRVSPDGHWLALAGDYSGRREIYIENFPTPTGRWRVSTGGGVQPVWGRDAKELFYLAPDGTLMAAPLKLSQAAEVGTPVPLFRTHTEGGGAASTGLWHQYDLTSDGKRFLVNTLVNQESNATPAAPALITVVLNWQSALGARER